MKKYAILFLLLMLMGIVTAQTPEWSWAQSAGGTTDDIGYSIAVDSNGNTYVTGFFKETASFDSITLTSSGNNDIFVAKLDSSGNWLWAKKAGGTNNDTGAGIALDSDGNIYLTGSFDSYPAYFGNIDLYCDLGEIFVAKLDSAGNWLWARSAGGVDSDRANCIAVDSAGGVYLSGYIGRSAHFGSILLTSHTVLDTDIFVAKLSSNGDWIWARGAGGPGSGDAGRGIAVDNLGNVYLTGDFIGIIADFGDTILTGAAQYKSDIFVAKLDSFGNWLWAKRAGGLEDDRSRAIAVDNAGNVYLTGGIWGTAEFGDTILIGAPFGFDIFVAKLDTEGEWIWAQKAGGPNNYSYDEQGYAIALDSNANVYVTGVFGAPAAFGNTSLSTSGLFDIFVAKMDSASNWLWAKSAGGAGKDHGNSIAVDSSANIYLTGSFGMGQGQQLTTTANFGDINLSSSGYYDIFVAKLGSDVGVSDDLNPPLPANKLTAWPNPFKQATTLNITLDKPGNSPQALRVALYDIKGRRVRTLVCAPTSGEDLTLSWDGRDASGALCPSGIYLARLYAGERQLSCAKVTLIR